MTDSKTHVVLGALAIVLAVAVAYANTFSVPFILDDLVTIALNPSIRHLWPLGPVLNPPAEIYTAGRPLYNLSYALNYAAGGTSVGGYHAVNLAIHLAAALALFGTVRRTLLLPALAEKFRGAATQLALLVALGWALHPVLTEAVTYLAQRSELLMGMFYFTTLYCFVRGTTAPRPEVWWSLAVASCLGGMASKEVMVTAPAVVLLFDRIFVAGSWRGVWRERARVHAALLGTWLLLAFLMLATDIAKRDVGTGGHLAWSTYVMTECHVVVDYLQLAVWPHPLTFYYGPELFRLANNVAGTLACAVVLAVLVGGSFTLGLRARAGAFVGFLGMAFFIALSPTSSVVPLAQQPMAESRLYVPLAAVVTAAVVGAFALFGRKIFPALLAAAVGFAVLAHARNTDYRSEVALWNDTVVKRPESSRAHSILAAVMAGTPALRSESIAHLYAALRLDPGNAEAHNNLANYLGSYTDRKLEAIEHYEQALRLKPDFAQAHSNLAITLTTLPGRELDALAHFEAAARVRPDDAEAHYLVGKMLAGLPGRVAEAVREFERALQLSPDVAQVHAGLADALGEIPGRDADALAHYREALRLAPDQITVRYNLAVLHARRGELDPAIAELEIALQAAPNFSAARDALQTLRQAKTRAIR